jgi:hypothetical protein
MTDRAAPPQRGGFGPPERRQRRVRKHTAAPQHHRTAHPPPVTQHEWREQGGEEARGGGRRIYRRRISSWKRAGGRFTVPTRARGSPRRPPPTRPNRPHEDENEPGRNSTNPRSVPWETGERGHFARWQPGSQMGQVNQAGRPASHGLRPPPALYIKRILRAS